MITIHIAGPPQAGGLYQECARCGHVLQDYTGHQLYTPEGDDTTIAHWPEGRRIGVNDGLTWTLADHIPLNPDETERRPTS